MKSLKILVSAYACQPDMGSEPGVGWNIVQELIKYHQVWVLTRTSNRPFIEAFIDQHPSQNNLIFVYCDPPRPAQYLKPAQVPHYYFWQISAYRMAKRLHHQIKFNAVHHVTYVRYSTPSFLSLLSAPLIFGPVGGGEQAPKPFWDDFNLRARMYEHIRSTIHRLGELDPFTRMTVRRSRLIRATTHETASRLYRLGAQNIEIDGESGLSQTEIGQLAQLKHPSDSPFRIISMARLLHWKGLHLSIRAFAQASLPDDAEYWIAGEGPERSTLEALVISLNIQDRVKFLGRLPRTEVLQKLSDCHVFAHPSLHDSGGWVCLEAMAAGRPVVCLDTGGPSIQVNDQTGIKIPAKSPQQVVQDMAEALSTLANDSALCIRLGEAGQQHVKDNFSWEQKGRQIAQRYVDLASQQSNKAGHSISCAF